MTDETLRKLKARYPTVDVGALRFIEHGFTMDGDERLSQEIRDAIEDIAAEEAKR